MRESSADLTTAGSVGMIWSTNRWSVISTAFALMRLRVRLRSAASGRSVNGGAKERKSEMSAREGGKGGGGGNNDREVCKRVLLLLLL